MHRAERTELISIAIMEGIRANGRNSDILAPTLGGIVNQHAAYFIEAIDQYQVTAGWKDLGEWQQRARIERIALANLRARYQALTPEQLDTEAEVRQVIQDAIIEAEQVLFVVDSPSVTPTLTGTSA